MKQIKKTLLIMAALFFQPCYPMESTKNLKNFLNLLSAKSFHKNLHFKDLLIKRPIDKSVRIKVINDPVINMVTPSIETSIPEKPLLIQLDQVKQLLSLIQALTKKGLSVKLISNGSRFEQKAFEYFAKAGLKGVSFNILELDPEEFLKKTTLRKFKSNTIPLRRINLNEDDFRYACKIIKQTTSNIVKAKETGLSVEINTVVVEHDNIDRLDRIVNFAIKHGVGINLFPSAQSSEHVDMVKQFASTCALFHNVCYSENERFSNESKITHYIVFPNYDFVVAFDDSLGSYKIDEL
jgi:hypothetical protein